MDIKFVFLRRMSHPPSVGSVLKSTGTNVSLVGEHMMGLGKDKVPPSLILHGGST